MPAPTPYLGRGANVRAAEEVAWGTAIATGSLTHAWRLCSESMKRTVAKSRRAVLAEASGSTNIRKHFVQSDKAGGSLEFLMQYEGMGVLLKHLLRCTPATSGPVGSLYTHTFEVGVVEPVGLTMEVNRGTGTAEIFEGCLLSKGTWKISAGDLMRLALDVVAETSGGRVAAGTPTYTTNELDVQHQQAGTFTFNAAQYYPKSVEISVDNKLSTREMLGSQLTAKPAISDFLEIRAKIDLEWGADTLNTALTADTEADANITFTGTAGRLLTFALHNCYVEEVSDPVSSAGIVSQSVTLRAQSDGTDEGLIITLVNFLATATAP